MIIDQNLSTSAKVVIDRRKSPAAAPIPLVQYWLAPETADSREIFTINSAV